MESEEEPSPPPKKKPRHRKKGTPAADKSGDTKGKVFLLERPYKPSMKYNTKVSKQKKVVYVVAHQEYHNTSTKAAQTDRIAMLKAMYKNHKAKGNSDGYKKVKKMYTKAKQKLSAME